MVKQLHWQMESKLSHASKKLHPNPRIRGLPLQPNKSPATNDHEESNKIRKFWIAYTRPRWYKFSSSKGNPRVCDWTCVWAAGMCFCVCARTPGAGMLSRGPPTGHLKTLLWCASVQAGGFGKRTKTFLWRKVQVQSL